MNAGWVPALRSSVKNAAPRPGQALGHRLTIFGLAVSRILDLERASEQRARQQNRPTVFWPRMVNSEGENIKGGGI